MVNMLITNQHHFNITNDFLIQENRNAIKGASVGKNLNSCCVGSLSNLEDRSILMVAIRMINGFVRTLKICLYNL